MLKKLTVFTALLAISLAATAQITAQSDETPVAIVNGTHITLAEVERAAIGDLTRLRREMHEAREQMLHRLVDRLLLVHEARSRNLSPQTLVTEKIEPKPPSDAEVRDFLHTAGFTKEELTPELLDQARSALAEQRRNEAYRSFLLDLRGQAKIEEHLEPYRDELPPLEGPTFGKEEAPVTVVAFLEYGSEFSRPAAEALWKLLDDFQGQVRITFEDLPETPAESTLRVAASVRCAARYDRLRDFQTRLWNVDTEPTRTVLESLAEDTGLDPREFAKCFDSPTVREQVLASTKTAHSLGLDLAPAVFVNGRLVPAGVPYPAYAEWVEDELRRLARPTRPEQSIEPILLEN